MFVTFVSTNQAKVAPSFLNQTVGQVNQVLFLDVFAAQVWIVVINPNQFVVPFFADFGHVQYGFFLVVLYTRDFASNAGCLFPRHGHYGEVDFHIIAFANVATFAGDLEHFQFENVVFHIFLPCFNLFVIYNTFYRVSYYIIGICPIFRPTEFVKF
jgi:hypothetical protein